MANYDWSHQTVWSPGAWISGAWAPGTWCLQGPLNSVAPVASGNDNTLSATTGTWSSGNGAITYTYQWRRNGVNIGAATASTYTLALLDSTLLVSCNITATDSISSSTRVTRCKSGRCKGVDGGDDRSRSEHGRSGSAVLAWRHGIAAANAADN